MSGAAGPFTALRATLTPLAASTGSAKATGDSNGGLATVCGGAAGFAGDWATGAGVWAGKAATAPATATGSRTIGVTRIASDRPLTASASPATATGRTAPRERL